MKKIICALLCCFLTILFFGCSDYLKKETSDTSAISDNDTINEKKIISIQAKYVGDGTPTMPLFVSDFEVTATYNDGTTITDSSPFIFIDIEIVGDNKLPDKGKKTFTIKEREQGIETKVTIEVAEVNYFPISREEFADKYHEKMQESGIDLIMEKFYEDGILSYAGFRNNKGAFFYDLEFEDLFDDSPSFYEYREYFTGVSISVRPYFNTNTMESLKAILILMTLPEESTMSVAGVHTVLGKNGEVSISGIDYVAYIDLSKWYMPNYYLAARQSQGYSSDN